MKRYMFAFTILVFTLLVGCNINGNPKPSDYLNKNNADIFMLDRVVYSNGQNIGWVKKKKYTLGKQIGEITNTTNSASRFKDGSANLLPVGTKIYKTNTVIYIAVVNEKKIPYIKEVEG